MSKFTRNTSPLPSLDGKFIPDWSLQSMLPCKKVQDFNLNLELKSNLMSLQNEFVHQFEKIIYAPESRKPVNTQLSPHKSQEFPYTAIVCIEAVFDNDHYLSRTGFMIGPRYVLTAAHNIKMEGKPADYIYVTPGRNKNEFHFGIHQVTYAFLAKSNNEKDNFAVLVLKEEIGYATGWFGLLDYGEDNQLSTLADSLELSIDDQSIQRESKSVSVTGFMPLHSKKASGRTYVIPQYLVTHKNRLGLKYHEEIPKKYRSDDLIAYDIDAPNNQSGSPVWIKDGKCYYAIGLHLKYLDNSKFGVGLKLTLEKIKVIKQWMAKDHMEMYQKVKEFNLRRKREQTDIKTQYLRKESNLSKKVEISFDKTTADDKGIKYAIEEIEQMKGVKILNINFINCERLTNKGLKSLFTFLQTIETIERIKINFIIPRLINYYGFKELGKGLSYLKSLKVIEINFSYCLKLSNDALKDIFLSLKSLSNLIHLCIFVIGCPLVKTLIRDDIVFNFGGPLKRLETFNLKILD